MRDNLRKPRIIISFTLIAALLVCQGIYLYFGLHRSLEEVLKNLLWLILLFGTPVLIGSLVYVLLQFLIRRRKRK
jgi:hypothetical protein